MTKELVTGNDEGLERRLAHLVEQRSSYDYVFGERVNHIVNYVNRVGREFSIFRREIGDLAIYYGMPVLAVAVSGMSIFNLFSDHSLPIKAGGVLFTAAVTYGVKCARDWADLHANSRGSSVHDDIPWPNLRFE